MRIKGVLLLVLAFMLIVINISFIFSEIRISEIELNPMGSDSGSEWIELYSSSQIDLIDYYMENFDGNKLEFNKSEKFEGYYIVELKKQWLDNADEGVKLFRNSDSNKISETSKLFDSANNGKSNQFCEGEWVFADGTKGEKNSCPKNYDKEQENKDDAEKVFVSNENNTANRSNTTNKNNTSGSDIEEKNEEIIVLTSKTIESKGIKNPNNVVYISKSEKIKKYITPILIVVCIFLVILLFVKRKDNKEKTKDD